MSKEEKYKKKVIEHLIALFRLQEVMQLEDEEDIECFTAVFKVKNLPVVVKLNFSSSFEVAIDDDYENTIKL